MDDMLAKCALCPRQCGVNRYKDHGFCQAGAEAEVALVSIHKWEEPCIAGAQGAGTVFFSHCNMRCVFCQNQAISRDESGHRVSVGRLAAIFLEQQARGAATLDLVTPTHYLPQIATALTVAKAKGLAIPVVYNSNAYEQPEALAHLAGLIDVYLPDLKYADDVLAIKYSAAPGYFAAAGAAIRKMVELAGPPVLDDNGIMCRGVLVRHLILPGCRADSRCVVKWLWEEFGDTIYLSLMNQYTPLAQAKDFPEINRQLTTLEYDSVVDYAYSLGFTQCFIQEGHTASEKFVPKFDGRGI